MLTGKIIGAISELEVAATKLKNTQWKSPIINTSDSPVASTKIDKALSRPVVATKLIRTISNPVAAISFGAISQPKSQVVEKN